MFSYLHSHMVAEDFASCLPVFHRECAAWWVEALEALLVTDDGQRFVKIFDNAVGLGYIEAAQCVSKEDRLALEWGTITCVVGPNVCGLYGFDSLVGRVTWAFDLADVW